MIKGGAPAAVRVALALAAGLSAAAPALADPLGDALEAGGGIVCFTRTYDDAWIAAHPGQTLREARFMVSERESDPWQVPRLMLRTDKDTLYLIGDCQWHEGINRSAQGNILIPSFKPVDGIGCMLLTDVTGASAEEGGFFLIDWQDQGHMIAIHLDEAAAGWRGLDGSGDPEWVEFNPADRVIRLERTDPAECSDLEKFAPGQPQ